IIRPPPKNTVLVIVRQGHLFLIETVKNTRTPMGLQFSEKVAPLPDWFEVNRRMVLAIRDDLAA
ncbi:hypothetical protein ACVGW3_15870, partial [Enterobacter hormaechei]